MTFSYRILFQLVHKSSMHCTCIIEFVCAISSCYNKQHGCELSPICCMLGYLTLLKTINSELFPKITDSEDLIFWKEKKQNHGFVYINFVSNVLYHSIEKKQHLEPFRTFIWVTHRDNLTKMDWQLYNSPNYIDGTEIFTSHVQVYFN